MKKKITYKKGLLIISSAFVTLILFGAVLNTIIKDNPTNSETQEVEQVFRKWINDQVEGRAKEVCKHITQKDLKIIASNSEFNYDFPEMACEELYTVKEAKTKEEKKEQEELQKKQEEAYKKLEITNITLNSKTTPPTATIEYNLPDYSHAEEDEITEYTIRAIKNSVWQFELEKTSAHSH